MSSVCFVGSMGKKSPLVLSETALQLVARRFAVLSEPMRLRLLHALFDGEKAVNALVGLSGGTQANVSRHLQTLADAGLLARRKEGLQVYYSISDPSIFELCTLVCGSLEKQHRIKAGEFGGRKGG
jgi:DNA-binding transcriptional ArsR family regulator